MTVVIAALLLIVSFYLLAVLTEEFFIPAIDRLAQKFKMSSDASGATLLAMGSSAPEFFTALFAVLGIAGGAGAADVGAGTIVGSAVFNVLVIIGASSLYRAVKLQWQPVIRDMLFYIVSIVLLLVAFADGKVVAWEAIGFLLVYGVYIWSVMKWRTWLKYDDTVVTEALEEKTRNRLGRWSYKLINLVIPDPRTKPNLYVVSFIAAIAAIAALSWLLVDQAIAIAEVLHINPTFVALTILAGGTSIPDMIGSMVVAKQGRGDMAVSNAVGSNVFNILFGLSVPWLIFMALGNGPVAVGTENLLASILLLLATVIAILFLLFIRKWRLGQKSGLVLIALYIAYCVYVAFTVA